MITCEVFKAIVDDLKTAEHLPLTAIGDPYQEIIETITGNIIEIKSLLDLWSKELLSHYIIKGSNAYKER